MDPITVAIDVGPLHGHRTGVGLAVDHLTTALRLRFDVALYPYVVSFRARASESEHKLPIPAGLATRLWAHGDRPRADRWLGGADVVHATNYVAPPSRLPTVVSAYDLWFLANRSGSTGAVQPGGSRAAARREARRVRPRQLAGDGRDGPGAARDRSCRGRAPRSLATADGRPRRSRPRDQWSAVPPRDRHVRTAQVAADPRRRVRPPRRPPRRQRARDGRRAGRRQRAGRRRRRRAPRRRSDPG